MTPTAVGWVLAEGHGADGTILDHQELALRAGRGVRAVNTAEQVVDEVLRVDTAAAASDQRLRVIGVTWNDDAAAQAALVLEALTDAGFDNVVPVRFLEAIETLAQAIAPVIGYEQTAVCILDHDATTVVMVDTQDGETQTATKQVRGGLDGLTRWLTGMFDRDGWQPGGVVVVGAHRDIDGFSWQLEKGLAGTGFRAIDGPGDDRTGRGAVRGPQHRVHRRTAGGAPQRTHFLSAGTTAAPVVRRGPHGVGRRCGHVRRLGVAGGGDSRGPGQRARVQAHHPPVHAPGRRGGQGRRAASCAPTGQATHPAARRRRVRCRAGRAGRATGRRWRSAAGSG